MEGGKAGRTYLKTGGASVPPPFRRISYGKALHKIKQHNV